ncbi:MAG: DUF4325 domain-containing protein [Burkholderiales bacterium]|nr:DUF4325 domain-containing protein [Burkholderiales bacterium]
MKVVSLLPDFGWPAFQGAARALYAMVVEQHIDAITIDLRAVQRAFPNGVVPLVVLLNQYRKNLGVHFGAMLPDSTDVARIFDTQNWAAHLFPDHGFPLTNRPSALHRFSETTVNELINGHIRDALGQASYAQGVLQAFEWALNEIAGNALVHSGAPEAWMEVVVQRSARRMAIVVADGGLGIPETIRHAFPDKAPRDEDAIALALQEGITSKPDFGQGKGLTGTLAIVKANDGGRLSVHSAGGVVEWRDARLSIRPEFPPFQGTMVDIQLSIEQPIDIETALWGQGPVFPFNEALFGRETPLGVMRFVLAREASGFGNRLTGQQVRLKIENLLTSAPDHVLEVDFAGVELIASSFADEVFGKLALSLGFVGFSSRLRLIRLNKFCRGIIDDVVKSRIVQAHGNGAHGK